MPNLNDVCLQILDVNEQLSTVAVVEIESALLLGLAYKNDNISLDYFETLAAAIVNIYVGRNTKTVETMIANMRQEPVITRIDQLNLVLNHENVYVSNLTYSSHILIFVIANKNADIDEVWDIIKDSIHNLSDVIN